MFSGNQPRKWRDRLIVAAVAIASVGLAKLIGSTSRFQTISRQWQDAHFLLRGQTPASGIVLVVVDKKSVDTLPEPLVEWRKHYAKVIVASAAAGAKALGLVAVPAKPLDDPAQDQALRDAAEYAYRTMPVVCAFDAGTSPNALFWSAPIVQWAAQRRLLGFSNVFTDEDDFIRRWELVGEPDADELSPPSFALLLAAASRRVDVRRSDDYRLSLGGEDIPLDERRSLRINYPGPAGVFPRVSLSDFLTAADRLDNAELRSWVSGRIVLIGYDLPEDRYATPFYSLWRGGERGGLPNTAPVEVQAAALHTLLERRYILDAAPEVAIAATLATACATAVIAWSFDVTGIALGLAAVILASVGGTQLMFRAGRMLSPAEVLAPGALALIGTLLCRSQLAERLGLLFEHALNVYVDPWIARFTRGEGTLPKGGAKEFVSILFSDIRGFTAFSSDKDPAEVVRLLDEYLSAMTAIILRHGGRVNKFIGDGILAIFSGGEHARRAVACGLEMIRLPYQFKTGVGIHSGEVVLGSIGSEDKMEFTALGDTVNVASRLESLNKDYKTQLILSEVTRAMLAESVRTVSLGEAEIRGKKEPMAIHTVEDLQANTATSAGGSGS